MAPPKLTFATRRRYDTKFLMDGVEQLREMGVFPTEYGLAPNRSAIRLIVQYCYEQGLISRLYEPEDLFVAS